MEIAMLLWLLSTLVLLFMGYKMRQAYNCSSQWSKMQKGTELVQFSFAMFAYVFAAGFAYHFSKEHLVVFVHILVHATWAYVCAEGIYHVVWHGRKDRITERVYWMLLFAGGTIIGSFVAYFSIAPYLTQVLLYLGTMLLLALTMAYLAKKDEAGKQALKILIHFNVVFFGILIATLPSLLRVM